jgi:DNA-binding NarL/FixJ family response regulator
VARDDDPRAQAAAKLAAGEYEQALARAEADVAEAPSADRLRLLAALYYLDDRIQESARCSEEAFAALRRDGRALDAARCAIDLATVYAGSLNQRSVGSGWLAQARRLLSEVGPCVEWGYLELAVIACYRPDVDDLIASADRALSIAIEYGDADLEAQSLADGGLGLVTAGRLGDGFARLDASLASVASGAVSPRMSGLCFCSMLSACDRAGDLRRAEQWTSVVDGVLDRLGDRPRPLHTHCRMTYGSVLLAAGRWNEAEALLTEALGGPASPSVTHRALTAAQLARLRVEQGRLAEAEDLLAPYEDSDISSLPLAHIHARRGELDLAAAVLRRTIDELVGDALRVSPLLLLLIDVEVQRGDIDAAQAALDRLLVLAQQVDGEHLAIDAVRGRARVAAARRDRESALAWFAAAKRLLVVADRQVQLAEVRLEVGELLAAEAAGPDDVALAITEARAALACFERVGATPGRDRAADLLRRLGDTPRRSTASATETLADLTQRERDVLGLIAEGLTNPQIAERLYISPKTAEHHVGRLLAKLGVRNRAEAAALFERGRTRIGE